VRVLLTALEHEVLEEVGHAVLLGALVAGAGIEGDQHSQRSCAGQRDLVHGQPVFCDGGCLGARHRRPR
jgi:hypothetical protein